MGAVEHSLLGGDADGYALVPAASYGLSTAARAVEPHLESGDRILVIAEEFPSNVLPWRRTAGEVGATLVTIPTPALGNWTQAILDRIENGVKVVALSTYQWANGAHIDLRPIGEACRDVGSILVVDATQSLGANAEDFTALVNYSDTYMAGARRFDVGEKCTATMLPGAIAALEQIQAWGVENISASLAAVNSTIAAHLEQLGFHLPGKAQRCPHMFGAQLPDGCARNFVAELKKRNIYDRLMNALEELAR